MGVRVTSVALVALLIGCGAKTGLEAPDAEVPAPDAEVAPADPEPVCIEAPPEAGSVTAELTIPVELAVVDVFFLMDASGSMRDEIENVRAGLRGFVVPSIREIIPDPGFGLAYFAEFPVAPHADSASRPYELRVPITGDVIAVEGALSLAPRWDNRDYPEAQVEALYQVATGAGLRGFIEPSPGCPGGGFGAACFRDDALPVVMLITDAPFHNGPDGANPYRFARPAPHVYDEAVRALREAGILVLGLGATDVLSPSPFPHLEAIATDTGALDERGRPLVFDIGDEGDGLDDGIIDAVRRLASDVPLDVTASVRDTPGDGVDALQVIRDIRPLRAEPMDAVAAVTDDAFLAAEPGTRVSFEVRIDATALEPTDEARHFPAEVVFRAAGRSVLGVRDVDVVVPGLNGEGCAEPAS